VEIYNNYLQLSAETPKAATVKDVTG
jgi:hypothetical protein